jgi:hypothetical protein
MARDYPLGRMALRTRVKTETARFMEKAKKRGPGTYTATQTGAKGLAELKEHAAEGERMIGAMTSQESQEKYIKGKKR